MMGASHVPAVKRAVNDAIAAVRLGDDATVHGFVCECRDEACGALVRLTAADYRARRAGAAVLSDSHLAFQAA